MRSNEETAYGVGRDNGLCLVQACVSESDSFRKMCVKGVYTHFSGNSYNSLIVYAVVTSTLISNKSLNRCLLASPPNIHERPAT